MSNKIGRLILLSLAVSAVSMVLVCLSYGHCDAGAVGPELQSFLETGQAKEVPVIILLSDRISPGIFKNTDRRNRRSEIIYALRSQSEKTQGPLKTFLKSKGVGAAKTLWIVNAVAAVIPGDTVSEIAAMGGVESVVLDSVISAPEPGAGAAIIPEWNINAVNVPALWNLGLTGTGVVVANMDTGVDLNHPDLSLKWRCSGRPSGAITSDCWYDPFSGSSFPYDFSGSSTGHGTATMGIMVAGSAGGTAVGVCPDAQWIAAKIFDDQGNSSTAQILSAFQWLLDPDGNPSSDDAPDIVNASWGLQDAAHACNTEFQAALEVLKASDIAVVFSAGNDGGFFNIMRQVGNGDGVTTGFDAILSYAVRPGSVIVLHDSAEAGSDDGNGTISGANIIASSSTVDYLTGAMHIEYQSPPAGGVMITARYDAGSSLSPGNNPGSLAVGSIDQSLFVAPSSSRGPSSCDLGLFPHLVAPGVNIRTTDISLGGIPLYTSLSGTSFAAPHVAGIMALLREAFPQVPVADMEQALKDSAYDLGPAGPDNDYGYGLVDGVGAYLSTYETLFGPVPNIVVLPESYDFGNARTGGNSSVAVFTVTNSGKSDLAIGPLRTSGAAAASFVIKEDNCTGQNIAPFSYCSVGMVFSPLTGGMKSAFLMISSNDPDTPQLNLILSGQGITGFPGDEIGVFRDGKWYLDMNGNGVWEGCLVDRCRSFGLATDVPVVGDWSGTGTTSIGVKRGAEWYLDYNGNGKWDGCGNDDLHDRCYVFGLAGDVPVTGDWNGDGLTELGVKRDKDWFLDYNGNGIWNGCASDKCTFFGLASDFPCSGDWNSDGMKKLGVFRNGAWFVDMDGNSSWGGCQADGCRTFGTEGDLPVAGSW